MTPREVLTQVEDVYEKQYTVRQTTVFLIYLGKFKPDQLNVMVQKVIETCRYRPKVADFQTAATTLLFVTKKEVMEPDPKCELCDGSGWEFVAWTDPRTGDSIEAVKRCSCRSLVVVDRKDEVGSLADF